MTNSKRKRMMKMMMRRKRQKRQPTPLHTYQTAAITIQKPARRTPQTDPRKIAIQTAPRLTPDPRKVRPNCGKVRSGPRSQIATRYQIYPTDPWRVRMRRFNLDWKVRTRRFNPDLLRSRKQPCQGRPTTSHPQKLRLMGQFRGKWTHQTPLEKCCQTQIVS